MTEDEQILYHMRHGGNVKGIEDASFQGKSRKEKAKIIQQVRQQVLRNQAARKGKPPKHTAAYLKAFHERAEKAGVKTEHEMQMFRMADAFSNRDIQKRMGHLFNHKQALIRHHTHITAHKASKHTRRPVKWLDTIDDMRACAKTNQHVCINSPSIKIDFKKPRLHI